MHSSRFFARETGEAVLGAAKETPSFLAAAAGKSYEITRELWPAARRLVEKLRTSNDTHDEGMKIYPVG